MGDIFSTWSSIYVFKKVVFYSVFEYVNFDLLDD